MKTNRLIFSILLLLCFSFSFAQKGVIINSGAIIEINEGAVLVIGDDLGLINNSTESIFDGTVIFSGNALQEIGGSESIIFNTLEIDNSNGVFLNVNSRVADQLILSSGVFDLTEYDLTLNDITTISGTFSSGNMINVDGIGSLIKEISGNDNFSLPVGDLTTSADYSPVNFNFTAGNYSNAYITLRVKNEKHPDNFSSSDYLNRYWILSSSGITNFSIDMTFNYVSGDIVGNESNIYGAIRENSSWNSFGQVSSFQISGTDNILADVTGVQSDLVGISEINNNITISYYNGTIFLNTNNNIKVKSIEIYNAVGKLIEIKSNNDSNDVEVPFSGTPGYYFIKLNTEKTYFVKKILIY